MMMFSTSGTSFTANAGALTDAIQKNVTGIRDMVENIDKEFSNVANSIGAGREQAFLLKQTLTEGLTEVTRLGGDVNKITLQIQGLQKTFGTQLVLNKNVTDELFATTQATGIAADVLFESYANVGKSIYEVNSEMAQIMENANLIGVNAKNVTVAVQANMSALSKFNFKDGVMGLADMAAKSAVLRVGMEKAVTSAEELYNPEKAQAFVNTLSRLGATGSSDLMNVEKVRFMARNDPAKLQEEIAKMSAQFVDETGKMSAVGMDFLKEIAKEANYGVDDLSKMGIAFSQIQEKKDLINQTGLQIADPKEIEKLTNLLTKGKDGKFEVTYEQDGKQVTKALQDMNSFEKEKLQEFLSDQNKQIKETFEAKPGEDKDLKKLVEQQMDISTKMAKTVEAIGTIVTSQIAGSKRGEEFVNTVSKDIDKLASTTFEKLDAQTDKIGKGFDIAIEASSKYAEKTINAAADGIGKIGGKTFETANNIFTKGEAVFDAVILRLQKSLDTGEVRDFVSFPGNNRMLTGPEGTFEVNENDTIMAGTDFPKTEEGVKKMMEILKSPQNPSISSPVETKPLLIPENMGVKSAMENQRERAISDIMMEQTSKNGETIKEIKSTNDINHKLDMTIDLKNVPTNMNQNELKSVLETMILKPEFLDKVRSATKSIEGTSFY
jgi:hypothetical protein